MFYFSRKCLKAKKIAGEVYTNAPYLRVKLTNKVLTIYAGVYLSLNLPLKHNFQVHKPASQQFFDCKYP